MSNYGIGVSGLRANATAIDVISTNIANAATVGYKAGEFLFQDQFFKALNPMDPARAGQGALQQNIRRLFNMGSVQDSANSLDMAITGASGMFQVASSTNPKEIFYTRNGQFAVSSEQSPAGQNYIVNENGMYLTGYASTDGVTIDDGDSLNKLTMPPIELPPVSTTNSEISVTLDARTNAFLTSGLVAFNPLIPTTYHHKVSQTVFSAQDNGGEHSLTLYYRRVQDKEMVVSYDSERSQFYYSPSPVAQPGSSPDAARVYMTEDTSAGIEFLTGPSRATQLSEPIESSDTDFTVPNVEGVRPYARVVVNGIDSGLIVDDDPVLNGENYDVTVFGAGFVNPHDTGARVEFFNMANDSAPFGAAPPSYDDTDGVYSLEFAEALPSYISEGQYLYTQVGTGTPSAVKTADSESIRIIGIDRDAKKLILSGEPDPDLEALTTKFIFYSPVTYSLTVQDGSKVTMKGDLFDNNTNQEFFAVTTQYEVFGQLDNRYFNNDGIDPEFNSNNPEGLEPTISSSYKPVAIQSFWAGKNVDSLVYDGESGDPAFRSAVTLNGLVSTTGTADPENRQAISFKLDLTGTRNYATPFSVDLSKQDGSSVAQINAVVVDKEGRIVGSYGDGRQYTSGQLALVQFNAVNDLISVGGNVFMAKAQENPGIEGYIVGKPGTKGLGEIRSSAVEASNVDLTNELVKLMQMQRMYSANSQSVRAWDDTLSTTIRMTGG
jgi:flagellar hook-basal body protein